MKITSTILTIALFGALSGCGFQKVLVESDHRISNDFKSYRSYYLISAENEENPYMNEVLENAIKFEMEVHGYREDDENPGLLVLYRVFDKDFKFTGNNEPYKITDDTQDYYSPVNYKLKAGTLLVQIIDLEKNQLVWQGYASGLINHKHIQNREVRHAVLRIFNKYQYFADGYLTAR
jgi:hypothetical protein